MQCTEIAQEYAKEKACEFAEWYLLNEKNYYQLKNSLDSRLKVALDHKRRV
jgi:hypothetical protein